jgi:hypothetical protein
MMLIFKNCKGAIANMYERRADDDGIIHSVPIAYWMLMYSNHTRLNPQDSF